MSGSIVVLTQTGHGTRVLPWLSLQTAERHSLLVVVPKPSKSFTTELKLILSLTNIAPGHTLRTKAELVHVLPRFVGTCKQRV